MLSQPAASLTDLALGLVALALAAASSRLDIHGSWRKTLWWLGATAMAGAVYHGFIVESDRADLAWAVISAMVVITISCTLAATVHDVLGTGHRRTFWLLRTLSLGAFAVLALLGHHGIGTILACEGVTMLCVLVLWGLALQRGHPRARAMLVALGVSALAGCLRALPDRAARVVGLDATSLYHIAQIPGVVLLYVALASTAALTMADAAEMQGATRPLTAS
jgi:hypothetical protein